VDERSVIRHSITERRRITPSANPPLQVEKIRHFLAKSLCSCNVPNLL
jgi:hypothetical protein